MKENLRYARLMRLAEQAQREARRQRAETRKTYRNGTGRMERLRRDLERLRGSRDTSPLGWARRGVFAPLRQAYAREVRGKGRNRHLAQRRVFDHAGYFAALLQIMPREQAQLRIADLVRCGTVCGAGVDQTACLALSTDSRTSVRATKG